MAQQNPTQFQLNYTKKNLPDSVVLDTLIYWRNRMYGQRLIGIDPSRYNGDTYGNLSQRINQDQNLPTNKRAFVITGSQTSHLPPQDLTREHFAVVSEYHPEQDKFAAEGPIRPSREAMTHGVVYDIDPSIIFVVHVHSPELYIHAEKLGLPKTSEPAVHATPKMAEQVRRALNDTNARDLGILVMNGPGDGVISFSSDPNVAGSILLEKLIELDDFFKRLGI